MRSTRKFGLLESSVQTCFGVGCWVITSRSCKVVMIQGNVTIAELRVKGVGVGEEVVQDREWYGW